MSIVAVPTANVVQANDDVQINNKCIAAKTPDSGQIGTECTVVRAFKLRKCSVDLGVRFKHHDISTETARTHRTTPYIRLGPRPREHIEANRRQSNRKTRPSNPFNYGHVKCAICGRLFFCEAMATQHYDGAIACSFECAAIMQ